MTFYELEQKCKRKRLIKTVIFLFFILIIVIGCLFLLFGKNSKQMTKKIIIKKHKSVKIQKTVKKHKEIVLLPYVDMNISQTNIVNSSDTANKKIKKSKTKKAFAENNKTVLLQSKILPSYKTCISIANKYLKEKDYINAFKWAKNANLQNSKDAMSWIISSKALYKMGKKEEAVKLLKIYNSYYNNETVQKLIKDFDEK